MPDKRALSVLTKLYWTSDGWREESLDPFAPPPLPSKRDFAYAKSKGVMFDSRPITAAEVVRGCRAAARRLNARSVADAFAASMTSRRLDLRSALSSYAAARRLPRHTCAMGGGYMCDICGCRESGDDPADFNALNFERFKWGGTSKLDPLYIMLDLELFGRETPLEPVAADWEALAEVLNRAAAMPRLARPGDLVNALQGAIPSNKQERQSLVSSLAVCGVLEPSGAPSFRTRFVRMTARTTPPGRVNEWDYPAQWWRGGDGVSKAGVREWFPSLKLTKGKWVVR